MDNNLGNNGCGCGCGCGHDDHHNHDNHRKIYLTLTDNTQLECDVLEAFEIEGKGYIAVLPENSETAMLYGFKEKEDGPELSNIEDDEEYKIASDAFMDLQMNPGE